MINADLTPALTAADIDRIIEMAWEDRTPFEAIQTQFGLTEPAVIQLMRQQLKASSWRRWRARVAGRATKHGALAPRGPGVFKANRQRLVSHNRIAKR